MGFLGSSLPTAGRGEGGVGCPSRFCLCSFSRPWGELVKNIFPEANENCRIVHVAAACKLNEVVVF